jgi:hypothetical protein
MGKNFGSVLIFTNQPVDGRHTQDLKVNPRPYM